MCVPLSSLCVLPVRRDCECIMSSLRELCAFFIFLFLILFPDCELDLIFYDCDWDQDCGWYVDFTVGCDLQIDPGL